MRVADAARQEKIFLSWEEKQRVWQLAARSAYHVRRVEIKAKREAREEMRLRKREAKQAEETRVALHRRQHGKQCLEDLILFVQAYSSVQLAPKTSDVFAQDVAGDAQRFGRSRVKKQKQDLFYLMTAQLGYAPGYGKRYTARKKRFHAIQSPVILSDTRVQRVPETTRRSRLAVASNFKTSRATSIPGRVVGSRLIGCRRVPRARHSPGCGINRRRRVSQTLTTFFLDEAEDFPVPHKMLVLRFLAVCCACLPMQKSSSSVFARMRDPVPLAESGQALYAMEEIPCPRVGRSCGRDVSFVRFVGALRSGDVWPESCGSRLGRWERKCLQRVIMDCCDASMQVRAERWFRKSCQNNFGSGRGGNHVEFQNCTEAIFFYDLRGLTLKFSNLLLGIILDQATRLGAGAWVIALVDAWVLWYGFSQSSMQ